MELPVAGHLDAGEVDETSAGYFRRLEHAPAFVSVEPFDHTDHRTISLDRRGQPGFTWLIGRTYMTADRVELKQPGKG